MGFKRKGQRKKSNTFGRTPGSWKRIMIRHGDKMIVWGLALWITCIYVGSVLLLEDERYGGACKDFPPSMLLAGTSLGEQAKAKAGTWCGHRGAALAHKASRGSRDSISYSSQLCTSLSKLVSPCKSACLPTDTPAQQSLHVLWGFFWAYQELCPPAPPQSPSQLTIYNSPQSPRTIRFDSGKFIPFAFSDLLFTTGSFIQLYFFNKYIIHCH